MKKYIFYSAFIISLILYGCDKPGPTELIDDESFEVEVLGKDLDNEYYTNGYDTSGVSENILNYTSYIAVSGIKLTRGGTTDKISSALTYVFDRSRPFRSPKNILLGYHTITPGIIRFDNTAARLTDYRVRYRENGMLIDSLLGKKYELFNINGRGVFDPFIFPYNSFINFSYDPFVGGPSANFDILTPKEITGNLRLIKNDRGLNIEITWNGDFSGQFFLIIGGVKLLNQQVFPFYRIRTKDDGRVLIPSSLLKNIPKDRFNKLAVSLVRKYDKYSSIGSNDVYAVSQSIHTIVVEIP